MTEFTLWSHKNLAEFAAASQEKMLEQNEQIAILKEQLRVALAAYRMGVVKNGNS